MTKRLVVFTGDLAYSVRMGIVELDRHLGDCDWLVMVHSPRRSIGRLLRSQWSNLRRNGLRWIPYQMHDVWRRLTAPRPVDAGATRRPGDEYAPEALARMRNLRILRVPDLHEPQSLSAVRDFAADLGLSLAAPILKRELFSMPRLGTINLHKGRLPDFRGMPPAFWELWHGEDSIGCSVHVVDEGLDTGPLLARGEVPREKHSDVRGLQIGLDEVAISLVNQAAADMLAGQARPMQQPSGGARTFRKPTLAQQATLSRRLAAPAIEPVFKRGLKACLASSALIAHRAGLASAAAPRVVVLLYHRVSDDARDNLTAGIAQFERQMRWVAEHCRAVPIEEVVAMQPIPRSSRPIVAVTFDDGYLDNYRFAAPILRRNRLPAAFFVSTGIVDSDKPFPHDMRRGNGPIAKMTWDQMRRMRTWGFTFGSHTVEHIDCAAEPETVVREELVRSRDCLRRELDVHDPILGYPYGGREHMTADRLELVKEAGYSACLSAYGGVNIASVARFDVRRVGISWQFGDRSFQRVCLGWP
ncbi:MAG: polysaccharide deacetylase family protein [Burkholderiaceae bacterium]|nr:polysaccharide deacetylase family protein [Burkholderiaceae bacterium]